jgi:hypothetical protein
MVSTRILPNPSTNIQPNEEFACKCRNAPNRYFPALDISRTNAPGYLYKKDKEKGIKNKEKKIRRKKKEV